jgi:hypothetical protein
MSGPEDLKPFPNAAVMLPDERDGKHVELREATTVTRCKIPSTRVKKPMFRKTRAK